MIWFPVDRPTFYPYGPSKGDIKASFLDYDEGQAGPIRLPQGFQFECNKYENLYVSTGRDM